MVGYEQGTALNEINSRSLVDPSGCAKLLTRKLGLAQAGSQSVGMAGRRADQPPMLDRAAIDWFAELNRGLDDELTPEAFQPRLQSQLALIDTLALQILAQAQADFPARNAAAVRVTLSDPCRAERPLGESLLFTLEAALA